MRLARRGAARADGGARTDRAGRHGGSYDASLPAGTHPNHEGFDNISPVKHRMDVPGLSAAGSAGDVTTPTFSYIGGTITWLTACPRAAPAIRYEIQYQATRIARYSYSCLGRYLGRYWYITLKRGRYVGRSLSPNLTDRPSNTDRVSSVRSVSVK